MSVAEPTLGGAPGATRLRSVEFRRQREATWRELEALVDRVERDGLDQLGPEALTRLPVLYRATVSALGVAREISLDRNVVAYLEGLCTRAYFCVYGPKRTLVSALRGFFLRSFPQAVRAHLVLIAVAALVLGAGVATSALLTLGDPQYFHTFVDATYAQGRGPEASTETLRAVLYETDATAAERLAAFSMYLFNRNAGIGILCFGLGFAAGLPTLFLLFVNGLILGAFAALYAQRGLGTDLWAWIAPHGVFEITAVVFCGAAGLAVARALLFPGQRTRRASLAVGGRAAARVVLGSVALFLVAGLVEGIFRQLVTDPTARIAAATMNATLLVAYLGLAGRSGGDADSDAEAVADVRGRHV
jgi:uncharacterized membrane protein SpoIIM required for sporulation